MSEGRISKVTGSLTVCAAAVSVLVGTTALIGTCISQNRNMGYKQGYKKGWDDSANVRHGLEVEASAELMAEIGSNPSFIMVYAEDINGSDWKIPVPFSEYMRFKVMSHRPNLSNYLLEFVTYNNRTVKRIAEGLTKKCTANEQKADAILDFVFQQFYDCRIEETREYVRYPIETLVDRNGDCEDTSILAAALMKSLGMDVALIDYTFPGKPGHIALGICGNYEGLYYTAHGKNYYFAETTGREWANNRSARRRIGDAPDIYKRMNAKIWVVPDVPPAPRKAGSLDNCLETRASTDI